MTQQEQTMFHSMLRTTLCFSFFVVMLATLGCRETPETASNRRSDNKTEDGARAPGEDRSRADKFRQRGEEKKESSRIDERYSKKSEYSEPYSPSRPYEPNAIAPRPLPGPPHTTPPTVPVVPLPQNREEYQAAVETNFQLVENEPLSTFSIDVDTASYANMRRYVQSGQRPPIDAVRIEEFINYFDYDYPQPKNKHPFSVNVEVAECPWAKNHELVRIGLKGREIDLAERSPSNLVFLLDVSGSMSDRKKLPLVKAAMRMLVNQLDSRDRVSIVVYASGTRVILPPTTADKKETIYTALDQFNAGGSTNGSGGIQMAYQSALANFVPGGTNRVILCTDGEFNVGITKREELISFIEQKAKSGVFLSVLGFGTGNLHDATAEQLADHGNGNYSYIDGASEAQKVLVEEMAGTLATIAKDVKIQVDFNPAKVSAYRLIGYDNRRLKKEDFKDDTKDAGEIGAGHTVTAIYEVVPVGQEIDSRYDRSKYEQPPEPVREQTTVAAASDELLEVRLRYKHPEESKSEEFRVPIKAGAAPFEEATDDFRFAAAVTAFGAILRDSEYRGNVTLSWVTETANTARGDDPSGNRVQFVQLVKTAESLR